MEKLISCAFNMDTACVGTSLRMGAFAPSTPSPWRMKSPAICTSGLNWITSIYNDPLAYADLILNGDPEVYLKTVTEYKPLE